MARSREFDPNAVLDTAVELFWAKGYGQCGVADVVDASGVARYGIYQAFGDKDALYRAALKRYQRIVRDDFLAELRAPDAGLGAIEAHFERMLGMLSEGDRRGCLACVAAIERAPLDREVAAIVDDTLTLMRDAFSNAVDGALARSEIRPVERAWLIEYLVGLQRTLGTLVRSQTPAREIEQCVRGALALLPV